MQKSKDRPVVEATLESTEAIADIWMRDEIFAEIPVFGTAIKLCKAADAIRDRIFASKLLTFCRDMANITEEQKKRLKEKTLANKAEAQKIGETLLFVLERVTDLNKPALLSRIFLAYIDGAVPAEEFRRLCHAVDTAFSDDLLRLLTADVIHGKSDEYWMQYLAPSGLTRPIGSDMAREIGTIFYQITPLGTMLRTVYAAEQHEA